MVNPKALDKLVEQVEGLIFAAYSQGRADLLQELSNGALRVNGKRRVKLGTKRVRCTTVGRNMRRVLIAVKDGAELNKLNFSHSKLNLLLDRLCRQKLIEKENDTYKITKVGHGWLERNTNHA